MKILIFVVSACLLAGCATDLKPAPEARSVAGLEEAARSSAEGVEIVAQADEWPGPVAIENEVTPLRIEVVNNSARPLRIGYDHFALVAPTGRRFSALPPYRVEGEVTRNIDPGYASVTAPLFKHREFELAPAYAPYYPGIRPYRGSYYYDAFYHGAYYPRWVEIDLPTDEMLQRAIPEGVLNPGGRVDGYLYFEHVSDDFAEVVFRADLVNARSGENFGEIRTPFQVE